MKMRIENNSFIGNCSLEVDGGVLRYTLLKRETVIPIAQVKSVEIKAARGAMRQGMITIDIGRQNDAFIGVGRAAFGVGSQIVLALTVEQNDTAKSIQEYITTYQSAPPQQASAADEIIKYKGLLDAGVITEDEFNAKKKQLMEI